MYETEVHNTIGRRNSNHHLFPLMFRRHNFINEYSLPQPLLLPMHAVIGRYIHGNARQGMDRNPFESASQDEMECPKTQTARNGSAQP
jgi:hypothetical protein